MSVSGSSATVGPDESWSFLITARAVHLLTSGACSGFRGCVGPKGLRDRMLCARMAVSKVLLPGEGCAGRLERRELSSEGPGWEGPGLYTCVSRESRLLPSWLQKKSRDHISSESTRQTKKKSSSPQNMLESDSEV